MYATLMAREQANLAAAVLSTVRRDERRRYDDILAAMQTQLRFMLDCLDGTLTKQVYGDKAPSPAPGD